MEQKETNQTATGHRKRAAHHKKCRYCNSRLASLPGGVLRCINHEVHLHFKIENGMLVDAVVEDMEQ